MGFFREETNNGVDEASKLISSTKNSLESARKVRSNRMEYDALAKLIKEHPPRSDTANRLKLLNQELNSLKVKLLFLHFKISLNLTITDE